MSTLQPKSLKVLLLGDACTDVYHYGECRRLSPEAPVPVFKETYTEQMSGMGANVVANLRSLGVTTTMVTDSKPIEKHRYVDQKTKQHLLRVDVGDDLRSDEYVPSPEHFKGMDAVVISDYDKGFLVPAICRRITDYCAEKDIPVFVDSKKQDLSCYKSSIVKINEDEASLLVRLPETSELIITLGAAGAKYKNNIYPTESVEVFDVCGAGDVFLASFAFKYLVTSDIIESIKTANRCAAHSVTKFGTYVLTKEDIDGLRI